MLMIKYVVLSKWGLPKNLSNYTSSNHASKGHFSTKTTFVFIGFAFLLVWTGLTKQDFEPNF